MKPVRALNASLAATRMLPHERWLLRNQNKRQRKHPNPGNLTVTTENPKRKNLYKIQIHACRFLFVEASNPTRAAEIAEGETRFGDLEFDGCELTQLSGPDAQQAQACNRVLKE